MLAKPFEISRHTVYAAYKQVKSRKGEGGVDKMSLSDFEKDSKTYLYKIWIRMSSDSYMVPPVKLVKIPKKGSGVRPLGIPTICDPIAQTVVKMQIEERLEKIFHEDSYGYRPNKNAHQALATAKARCWKKDWVIDLDIKGFFGNIPHNLLMNVVRRHCNEKWVLLYIKRWLVASLEKENGEIVARTKGVPQGSVIGPLLANLYDTWLERNYPKCKFERYADDAIIHCSSEQKAREVKEQLEARMQEYGMELHPEKTKIVYCIARTEIEKEKPPNTYSSTFWGTRSCQEWHRTAKGKYGLPTDYRLPAVSKKAINSMNEKKSNWGLIFLISSCTLANIAKAINLIVRGWINYYGKFYESKLRNFMHTLNVKLAKWARRKYKSLRVSGNKAMNWLYKVSQESPNLLAHWTIGAILSIGINNKSRMTGGRHVRFCENFGTACPVLLDRTSVFFYKSREYNIMIKRKVSGGVALVVGLPKISSNFGACLKPSWYISVDSPSFKP